MDINYSDNSHILGVPFVIKEELHASVEINRQDLKSYLERTAHLPIEFHFVFEEE